MCLLSRKQAPAGTCGMTALQISMETSEELEGTEATVQRMETAGEEGAVVLGLTFLLSSVRWW